MDAVIYARVSTDVQRDNYSIPTQVEECVKFCQQKGYNLVGDHFVDPETGLDHASGNGMIPAYVDNFTSREISRPGINAMFEFLDETGFDVVVVHAIDRMARDPFVREYIERDFKKLNVFVEYVSGNYDRSPEGEVKKDLEAVFGKWENAKRVERSNRGKKKKAESGLFVCGRSPYGYTIDHNQLGGLAVVEEEAEVIRMIFNLYINKNESIRSITNELTKLQIPTATGKKQWYKSSLHRILNNPTYAGYLYYNKTKRVGNNLVERDESEWIKIEVTPVVDSQLFTQAQNKLEKNKRVRKRRADRSYLLTGMINCDLCDRVYSGGTQKAGKHRRLHDAQYYRHRKSHGHCMNRHISARILEPVVWEEVKKILLDPSHLRQGYEEALQLEGKQHRENRIRVEELHHDLIKLDRQNERVTEVFIDPDLPMSREEYINQKEKMEEKKQIILITLEELNERISTFTPPPAIETMERFTREIRQRFTGENLFQKKEKREILDLLDINVWIGEGDSFRLTGRINPPSDRLAYSSY